jgi:hypothetical protein
MSSSTETSATFEVGALVGPERTWGQTSPGDRFALPHGEVVKVKSHTKRHVTFHGDRPIDQNISPLQNLHPGAVYLGATSEHWHVEILDATVAILREPGAVVVRHTNTGPQVVSRVYNADDYKDTTELRRVAVRRSTQLLNEDRDGWNYYVVIRYAGGEVVVWTGMHSILCERGGES